MTPLDKQWNMDLEKAFTDVWYEIWGQLMVKFHGQVLGTIWSDSWIYKILSQIMNECEKHHVVK